MKLPTLLLALLASSFSTITTLAQRTPIEESTFQAISRYVRFASASYSSNCASPPYNSVVERYIDEPSTDTQATLFRDDAAAELILSFRGTSSVQDFLTDLDQELVPCSAAVGISCTDCTCANGYLGQYTSVQATIFSTLQASLAAHPSYALIVTGHSMGGALASIAATALTGRGLPLTAYTYGQPRTGNPSYADYVDSVLPIVRVTHDNDGVPQIPDPSDGYRHHGTEYWQAEDPASVADTYDCSAGGQEPADCNLSRYGFGIGNDGRGINAAHLRYLGVSIGNPLDANAAC